MTPTLQAKAEALSFRIAGMFGKSVVSLGTVQADLFAFAAEVRREALEEAARYLDRREDGYWTEEAAHIRALASKPGGGR